MTEQCKFRDGDNNFQCNPIKSLKALKEQVGNTFSIKELKQIVCESNANGDCPAYRDLELFGRKSEFARATA